MQEQSLAVQNDTEWHSRFKKASSFVCRLLSKVPFEILEPELNGQGTIPQEEITIKVLEVLSQHAVSDFRNDLAKKYQIKLRMNPNDLAEEARTLGYQDPTQYAYALAADPSLNNLATESQRVEYTRIQLIEPMKNKLGFREPLGMGDTLVLDFYINRYCSYLKRIKDFAQATAQALFLGDNSEQALRKGWDALALLTPEMAGIYIQTTTSPPSKDRLTTMLTIGRLIGHCVLH